MKKVGLFLLVLLPLSLEAQSLPRFNYYDIDLFSAGIAEELNLYSGLSFDHFNGKTLFHFGFLGGYGDLKFVAAELGLGFSLPGSQYLKDQPVSRILDVERTPTYYGEQVTYTYEKLRTDMARLRLLEAGLFALIWSEYNQNYYGDDADVYGDIYYNIDDIDYHANDLVLYLGYKMMKIPRLNLTTSEVSWYARGLLGFTSRNADIYFNDYSTGTAERELELALGAEIGLKYYITQFRAGIYAGYPYFSVGFRVPWSRKFYKPKQESVKSFRYP